MLLQWLAVLALALVLGTGCAEPVSLVARSPGAGESHEFFWPPPPPTSTWTANAKPPITFGEAAKRIADALRDAHYADTRWYPIGYDYAHGFAVVTRLEQIDSQGRPTETRWHPFYPEASTLFWLQRARAPRLPSPGRYRVLLIAFTDLPSATSRVAPRWTEETWMDGPESRPTAIPLARVASVGSRISAYIYEYAGTASEDQGAFVATDFDRDGDAHMRGAGLHGLALSE